MREIVFKMERPGLVEEGQTVEVSESVSPVNVNYMSSRRWPCRGFLSLTSG